ncbi:MAG: class I SAM-dependent methyltransferase [Planctomycetes bacterium]|nr:class I SAM-dependent methyltransferase [Planctomycetota bacterium]
MAEYEPHPRRRVLCAVLAVAAVVAGLVAGVAALPALAEGEATPLAGGAMRAGGLAALAERFAEFRDDLPPAALLGVEKLIAYEESPHFVYVRGTGPAGDRQVVFIKPGTFVVDDRSPAPVPPWQLAGGGEAKAACRVLLPRDGAKEPAARFIRVICTGGQEAEATLAAEAGVATLKLAVGDRAVTLVLAGDPAQGSTIAVSQAGKALLAERLLPAGIMPHGAKGVRMLERWDSAYRGGRTPGWDVGRVTDELSKIVEDGTIRPGRALELGCGTGTNAVYLATKGFSVTGVEIAPTALTLAEQQARKANVRVRWLVADVTALGEMEPFDFVFDRGCYHHVQLYNSAGFVKTANRLTRPGGHFLLLAGNANEPRHGGPPRVEEKKLVDDFAETWDFVCLREIRFESRDPNNKSGPWAWSLLMRRRPPKE